MRELRDLRAEQLGITLPGRRVVDPFEEGETLAGAELEGLFRITRPEGTTTKIAPLRRHALMPPPPPAPPVVAPTKHPAPAVVQKSMTRYPRKVAPR